MHAREPESRGMPVGIATGTGAAAGRGEPRGRSAAGGPQVTCDAGPGADATLGIDPLLQILEHHAIISVTDAHGVITRVNDRFCEISGFTREELVGADHRLINSGHHPRQFWSGMWRTLASGRSWRGEVCNRAKNGSRYWVDSIISPVLGPDGGIESITSIRYDITDRVQNQLELQEGIHRLGMAARIACIGVWDWNLLNNEVAWDAKMFDIYGIEPTEDSRVTYATWAGLVFPEDLRASERVLRQTMTHGGVSEREFRIRRPDGEVRVIQAVEMCIPAQGGVSARMIGVNRDITAQRGAEARLAESVAVIEHQNGELSRLAERAHRVVDDVSHEFRTPLSVIKEFASIIADGLAGPVSEQQTEYLRIMDGAVVDLNHMVEDLLDSSKLRAGRLRVERRGHTVESILSAARTPLSRKASMRSITLEERVPEGLPRVFADEEKVRRIVSNLVSNAVKFSPERSTISITAECGEGGDEVVLSVIDQGPGLSAEDIDHLFGRFEQTSSGRSAAAKGFGLGLSIARELAWLNLGRLGVESKRGKGARFWFSLPVDEPTAVLRHFFEAVRAGDAVNAEMALLRVECEPIASSRPCEPGEFLASSTSPTDLVLPATEPGVWWMLGRTSSAAGWVRRLRAARNDCENENAMTVCPMKISLHARWSYPEGMDDAAAECERLITGATAHV